MKNYNLLNISKGSGKMENIQSINTNTLTNNYCIKQSKNKNSICNKCYSMRMLDTMRKNCIPNFQQNSELLSKSIIHVDLLPNVLNLSLIHI